MTLGSCRVKKEDSVGAGPQNMSVNLFLMAQYAGQSNIQLSICLCMASQEAVTKLCCAFSEFTDFCDMKAVSSGRRGAKGAAKQANVFPVEKQAVADNF